MRQLARLAIALWLNSVAFLAVGGAAFADHTSGIEGGAYAQPWVIIVITFLFAGVGGLALLWAYRGGPFGGVGVEAGRRGQVRRSGPQHRRAGRGLRRGDTGDRRPLPDVHLADHRLGRWLRSVVSARGYRGRLQVLRVGYAQRDVPGRSARTGFHRLH